MSISETIKNKATEQKGGFLRILLVTLTAMMLGNMFAGEIRVIEGVIWGYHRVIWAGEGATRAGQNF